MMKTAGERLREERERRGLSIEEVHRLTKIRIEQIRDLEDNEFGNFPSLLYAKSFLKLYGKFLKVDLTDTLDFFEPTPIGENGVMFFRKPIAFAGRARLPSAGRFRQKSSESKISAARANSPRPELPRSGGGGLFWLLGFLMLAGVLIAVKFSVDLARINTASKSPGAGNETVSKPEILSGGPAASTPAPSVRQIVAAQGPIAAAGSDEQNANGPAEPVAHDATVASAEPVVRAEPVIRAEPVRPVTAQTAPPAAAAPSAQSVGGSQNPPGTSEVRRAERVERAAPAPPRTVRPY